MCILLLCLPPKNYSCVCLEGCFTDPSYDFDHYKSTRQGEKILLRVQDEGSPQPLQ